MCDAGQEEEQEEAVAAAAEEEVEEDGQSARLRMLLITNAKNATVDSRIQKMQKQAYAYVVIVKFKDTFALADMEAFGLVHISNMEAKLADSTALAAAITTAVLISLPPSPPYLPVSLPSPALYAKTHLNSCPFLSRVFLWQGAPPPAEIEAPVTVAGGYGVDYAQADRMLSLIRCPDSSYVTVFDEDYFFDILGSLQTRALLFLYTFTPSYFLTHTNRYTNCRKPTDQRGIPGPDMKENVAKTLAYNKSLHADPKPQPSLLFETLMLL
jgi:hypothetical protein